MRKGLTALFLILISLSGQVLAQSRTVKGKVTAAEDGTPIIGATILAKGTNVGTVTNAEGVYSLNVPDGVTTLVVKFIGMKDVEARINGTQVDIVLSQDITTLTETVVTAQAIRRDKRSLGYSAPTVKGDDITRGQSSSALNGLSGKVAGVNITSTASAPGSSSRIVLRGGSSIAGNNQALLVVDGVPIDNSSVIGGGDSRSSIDFGNRGNDINPDDIESISVLKGPAAAALYGSRASNGALIITTKTGKKGGAGRKQEIAYTSSLTFSNVLKLPDFQNEFGQGYPIVDVPVNPDDYYIDPLENFSWGPKFDGSMKEWGQAINGVRLSKPWVAVPDNVKKFFELGKAWNNNVSLSGGNDKSTYYLSLGSLNSNGVMPSNLDRYNKYSVRFNGSTELSNKFSTSIGINYTRINSNMVQGGQGNGSVYDNVLQTPRDIPLQDMDDLTNPYYSYGDVLRDADGNPVYGYYGAYTDQPYWVMKNFKNYNNVDRITGNFTVSYKPTSWLTVVERLGADVYADRRRFHQPKFTFQPADHDLYSAKNAVGQYAENTINVSDITHDLMVTAEKKFSNDFTASLLVGNNIRQRNISTLDATTNTAGLIIPGWFNLANSSGPPLSENTSATRRLVGLYGELNLAYKSMLFLGASARNDWSSTLPAANRSFFYPSVNASFVFTELTKDTRFSEILNYGKIRASWASVGNDADPYLLLNYYVKTAIVGNFANTQFPFGSIPGLTVGNTIGNPNLQPERTNAFEVGTELGFLDNRIYVDFSYYQNKSKDQILAAPISPATGFTNEVMNTGVIENKGVELSLRATPVRTSTGFTWEVFGTYTKNKNTVVSLLPGVDQVIIGGVGGMSIVAAVGRPYGTFYTRDILRDPQGRMVVNGETGLPEQTDNAVYLGSYNPDFQASWGTSLSYKGLSLSVLFDTKQGGQFYSRTSDIMSFVGTSPLTMRNGRDYTVVEPNTVYLENGNYVENKTVPTNWYDFYTSQANVPDAVHVYDASYIKLREASISYKFPRTMLNRTPFGDLSVGLFGNNLWIRTPKENTYADPEMNSGGAGNEQGFDFTAQPSLRNFGVNLKVTF